MSEEFRTGDTGFMSLATIGGNLPTRHPTNINHVHKDSNYLLSVIMALGTDVDGGETVFYGTTMTYIGKIAHFLKHPNGRCVVGAFYRILHEGYIWIGHRYVLSFILQKSRFLHFVHHGKNV